MRIELVEDIEPSQQDIMWLLRNDPQLVFWLMCTLTSFLTCAFILCCSKRTLDKRD